MIQRIRQGRRQCLPPLFVANLLVQSARAKREASPRVVALFLLITSATVVASTIFYLCK